MSFLYNWTDRHEIPTEKRQSACSTEP